MPERTEEIARRVGRNALHVFGGEISVKLLAAIYQVLLARYLGARIFGELTFALALTAVLGILADFGLSTFVTREVARRPESVRPLLVRALRARFVLAVLLGALGVVVTLGTGRSREVVELVAILALTQVVQGVAELASAAHRGLQKMLLPALTGVACRLGLVATGIAAMALGAPVHAFAVLAAVWTVPAAVILLRALPRPPGDPAPPSRDVIPALRAALPIGLGVVLWTYSFRVNFLLLGWLEGDAEVGLFAAPFRLVEAALLLSGPMLAAVFPVLARSSPAEEASRAAFRHSARVLILLGGPVAAVLAIHADLWPALLFGESFAASGSALRLLSLTIPVSFVAAPFLLLLLSRDRERRYALIMTASAALNTGLGLPFILAWGIEGAAGAFLATEVAVLALTLALARREAEGAGAARPLLAALAASGVLAAALLVLDRAGAHLALQLVLGIVLVYPAAGYAFGAWRGRDLRLLMEVLGFARRTSR